jgi:hypothetical protein
MEEHSQLSNQAYLKRIKQNRPSPTSVRATWLSFADQITSCIFTFTRCRLRRPHPRRLSRCSSASQSRPQHSSPVFRQGMRPSTSSPLSRCGPQASPVPDPNFRTLLLHRTFRSFIHSLGIE